MADQINIEHLAELGNIKLTKEEKRRFSTQIQNIINFIDEVQKVKTDIVPPTFQVTNQESQSRKDKVGKCLELRAVIRNAPKSENGYIKVPEIISRDE